MKKIFTLLCSAMAILALSSLSTSCSKSESGDKETALDFTKLILDGSSWQITKYEAELKTSPSMWRLGGDEDLKKLVAAGTATLEFFKTSKGEDICTIEEDSQIYTPYAYDTSDGKPWLIIGWDYGYENEGEPKFKYDKTYVYLTWESNVHGGYPIVTIEAKTELKNLTFSK